MARCTEAILFVERNMHDWAFNKAFDAADQFLRWAAKYWHSRMGGSEVDSTHIRQTLIDSFHMMRIATVLVHPMVPAGCEKIRDQLRMDENFWNWEYIFEPCTFFMADPAEHQLKFLAPPEDFFEKHPSQFS